MQVFSLIACRGRIKIDIINFIKSRSAFALMNHLPAAGLVVQGKMLRKHQPWYRPRAAQEAMSNAISYRPTRSESSFITKPYNPSFHSPVKTQNVQPFFVLLKILLPSAMKIKVYPRKPCFQQKRERGMKTTLNRSDNPDAPPAGEREKALAPALKADDFFSR
jgi:hypothetical protein